MTVNATSSGMRPIRVGLIGAGHWAHHGHLPVLTLLPEYEIATIQSRRREVAETAATRFKIPHVLDTAEQVARHPDVDLGIVLTTAPQTRLACAPPSQRAKTSTRSGPCRPAQRFRRVCAMPRSRPFAGSPADFSKWGKVIRAAKVKVGGELATASVLTAPSPWSCRSSSPQAPRDGE
jgi:hypothetical protein